LGKIKHPSTHKQNYTAHMKKRKKKKENAGRPAAYSVEGKKKAARGGAVATANALSGQGASRLFREIH